MIFKITDYAKFIISHQIFFTAHGTVDIRVLYIPDCQRISLLCPVLQFIPVVQLFQILYVNCEATTKVSIEEKWLKFFADTKHISQNNLSNKAMRIRI